jgi:hypothetical protein
MRQEGRRGTLRAVVILSLMSAILARGEIAVAAFDPLVLFSHVEGVVTRDGKPVAGAEIVQEARWSETDNPPVRHTQTDAAGRFEFPAMTRGSGLTRVVPSQPAVLQRITIRFQGKDYEGWRHTKDSYDPDTEADGGPFVLVCELSEKPDFEGTHYGICRLRK